MDDQPSGDTIVVTQKSSNVNWIWGLLTVAFAAALVRGHLGADTTTGRWVVDIVFGALTVVCAAAWIWFHRRPAMIGVSRRAIEFRHRGQTKASRLQGPGELYIHSSLAPGGKSRFYYLRVTGSEVTVPLQLFDTSEVEDACVAMGWRFVDRPD